MSTSTKVSKPLDRAKIVILGAGPTGLGAAHRLQELGFQNFILFEKESYAGGLAASFTDEKGFTWDIGGHVQFSHYKYFDDLMDKLLGNNWLNHQRESWVWFRDRFVPYPFQNNIRYLPKQAMRDCLSGLIKVYGEQNGKVLGSFREWIFASFGDGLANHFMIPYNFKVWAYPASELSYQWVGERIAHIDLERIVFNILDEHDDVNWGPNNTFRFPLRGGTGEIWRRLAARLPAANVCYRKKLTQLDTKRKWLYFQDGGTEEYDILISTIPLDILVGVSNLEPLKEIASHLRYSTVHVVGIGLKGAPPPHLQRKCWMYFPENSCSFYRATVFSNYSPNNVKDINQFWSLMLEVSESPVKPIDREQVVEDVITGLLNTRLIENKNDIVDVWHYVAEHGYPTPTLKRDQVLETLLPALEELEIFSRGRFGGWKYEVSNQDHSLMQGVELVNRLAMGENEITLWNPNQANRVITKRSEPHNKKIPA